MLASDPGGKSAAKSLLPDQHYIPTERNKYSKVCIPAGQPDLIRIYGFIFLRPGKPQNVLPEDQSDTIEDQSTSIEHQSPSIKNGSTSVEDQPNTLQHQPISTFTLGSVLFDAQHRQLLVNEKTIDLTGTETRVLGIFALSPNETIERSRLQKEIWEDEGVIVGRSLDMFISKLRKKTES